MTSQTRCATRAGVSPVRPTQTHCVSHLSIREAPRTRNLDDTGPSSRPFPAHTPSAPTSGHTLNLPHTCNPSAPGSERSNTVVSESTSPTGAPPCPSGVRVYATRSPLPHNPSRPPPYTYQRQHEFPPFPPLAQHPVLPFLTTAFSEQTDTQPPPPKSRQTIAPRTSTTQRHVQSSVSMIPTMDVTRMDPNATFIRPPFVVPLPRNADNCVGPNALNGISTDGEPVPGTPLTYAILHAHRDWFLDPEDFHKDNPNRIEYPPELEPPRGWAPLFESAGEASKFKQESEAYERTNRTKGSYAHAGNTSNDKAVPYGPSDDRHEKTVLRCTFCRREYHGPNAKSMWRRHVYDKHKVAMKNRREGSAGMAPKGSFIKKAKKATESEFFPGFPSLDAAAPLDTSPLTLDLKNEENLIRLLERVVSGNLEISLPASLVNRCSSSDETTPSLNLQSIARALQKSGISLALQKGTTQSENPHGEGSADDDQGKEESTDAGSVKPSASSACGVTEYQQSSPPHPSLVAMTVQATSIERSPNSSIAPEYLAARHSVISSLRSVQSDSPSLGRKPSVEAIDLDGHANAPTVCGRAPLKDNTALDRNNHNSNTRIIPGTPHKGKQKGLPRTPGASKVRHASPQISSSSSRNQYTPTQHLSTTALRSRALATTGEESYLTLVLSSPDTASPIRRVSFPSPFSRRTAHVKDEDKDCDPARDDALGLLGTSSPRYSFDFNIVGTHGSSYLPAFDPIPIEVATLSPTPWTPPALGPPAPMSEPTSRTMSRASSVQDDAEDDGTNEDKRELRLGWSPPSNIIPLRFSHGKKAQDDDFDMEAFLDLEDAGPASSISLPTSPHKSVASHGFSKEFGLLSPEEVDRITASARPTFEAEARGSKRRKVDGSP